MKFTLFEIELPSSDNDYDCGFAICEFMKYDNEMCRSLFSIERLEHEWHIDFLWINII